jgi:hypothetical protein
MPYDFISEHVSFLEFLDYLAFFAWSLAHDIMQICVSFIAD